MPDFPALNYNPPINSRLPITSNQIRVSTRTTLEGLKCGYPLNTGQSACVDVAVGWANGSIVNPTLMPRISWVAKSMQPNLHRNLSRLKMVAINTYRLH